MSVGVDIFESIIFVKRPISLPMMQLSTKNENMINEDKWESSTNRKTRFIFDEWSKLLLVRPPYEKDQKIEKCQTFSFDKCSKYFFDTPLSSQGI